MERRQDGGDAGQEPVKEIDAPQEALQLNFGSRSRDGRDRVHLGGKRANTRGVHSVPKVCHLTGCQNTLLLIEAQTSVGETS